MVFSARFDEEDEDNQILDKTELYINLNNKNNLTESDLDNINALFALEEQIQRQELNDSGWIIDKKKFYDYIFLWKLVKLLVQDIYKNALRCSALLIVQMMIKIIPFGLN